MASVRLTWRVLVALCLAVVVLVSATEARADKLRVYTKPVEPFSFQQDGKAAGFSIELWDRIAKETAKSRSYTGRSRWRKSSPP